MTSKVQHGLPALPVISNLISICCSSFFLLSTPNTLASCCSSNRLVTLLFQEGGPLLGPKSGLLSNTQKLVVWGYTWADKTRGFIGKRAWAESSGVREPRGSALPRGSQSWVLWWWDYFPGCLWPIILTQGTSWWDTHCSPKMDASEKDSGRWKDACISFWPFLNSSGLWWLISSVFFAGTSCPKITHTWLLWCLARVGGFRQFASPNTPPLESSCPPPIGLTPLSPSALGSDATFQRGFSWPLCVRLYFSIPT